MFYFEYIQGKKILKSDLIKKAQAFFTTRETFIKSEQPDKLTIINNNRKLISDYLQIQENNIIHPQQTHSANINLAQKNKTDYPNTDSLILTNPTQAIYLNFADCTPLIFYDEKQNIGAIAHAGWRGTAKKIGILTAEKLVKEFNTKLSDINVLIGPAISKCCYDVGQEVLEQLKNSVINSNRLYEYKDNKIFVDLKNINKTQLTEIGIEKIDVCPYCTCCDNELFFSYRKEQGTTNRHNAILKLIY